MLKCKADISELYIYSNYKDKLDDYITTNLSYFEGDGKVIKLGKGCSQSFLKRKMAELLTNFFSLINCHPEVVEQAFKNLKYF